MKIPKGPYRLKSQKEIWPNGQTNTYCWIVGPTDVSANPQVKDFNDAWQEGYRAAMGER